MNKRRQQNQGDKIGGKGQIVPSREALLPEDSIARAGSGCKGRIRLQGQDSVARAGFDCKDRDIKKKGKLPCINY